MSKVITNFTSLIEYYFHRSGSRYTLHTTLPMFHYTNTYFDCFTHTGSHSNRVDRHRIDNSIADAKSWTLQTWILGRSTVSVCSTHFMVADNKFHDTRDDLAVWKRWVTLIMTNWNNKIISSFLDFSILISGSTFLNHKIFEFLGRISFTTYCLNPLVIMVFVFSCEQAFHVDLLGLIPSIIGFYGVTILASLAFILLIEYPISRIIHSLL